MRFLAFLEIRHWLETRLYWTETTHFNIGVPIVWVLLGWSLQLIMPIMGLIVELLGGRVRREVGESRGAT
jgi:hypothetical protein